MSKKKKKEQEKESKLKKNNPKNVERALQDETIQSIVAIALFIVSFFLILSSFGKAGVVGEKIYKFFDMLFGFGYYLLPLIMLMLAIAFFQNLERKFSSMKIVGAFILFLSGLPLLEVGSSELGGKVGRMIATPLLNLFDVYATVAGLFALIIVATLIMFDTHLKSQADAFFEMTAKMFRRKEKEDEDEKKKEDVKEPKIMRNGVVEKEDKSEEKVNDKNKKEEEEPKKESKGAFFGKKEVSEEEAFMGKGIPQLLRGKTYVPPPLSLLEVDKGKPGVGDIKANANIIKRTLQNFGIDVEMDEITIGPTVTRYALKPAEGVKLSRIVGLQDNLALALAAQTIRIEAPIPGKALVGIEVPNTSKTTVGLGSLIASKEFQGSPKPLLMAIGKDVSGVANLTDLAKMPHLLIAGTTGSGKSVTVHALLTSLLYRNSPDMVKFIMVDAKRVELTLYNKIPHLLTPVITEAKKTILALKWAGKEMDRRYDLLEKCSVRDIHSYHKNIVEPTLKVTNLENPPETMPYIVVVIDELADLMQAYPRELEASIVRLAQMSRAVGIHLILSTQRPSVNVITGLIKANIPTRIALKVGSQIDSRTIIDKAGAEKLVGQGDMLLVTQDKSEPVRIQSPYISENEVKKVVKYLIDEYKDEVPELGIELVPKKEGQDGTNPIFGSGINLGDDFGEDGEEDDELYEQAKETVMQAGKASTSYIQRKLRVGYARAARLMDILEERGVIGPADGAKPRDVIGYEKQPEEEVL